MPPEYFGHAFVNLKTEYFYRAVLPPSAAKVAPVLNAALSDDRNTIIWAISSGLPMRWSGTPATKPAFRSAVPVKRVSIAVSMGPGAMQFTLMPCAPHSPA